MARRQKNTIDSRRTAFEERGCNEIDENDEADCKSSWDQSGGVECSFVCDWIHVASSPLVERVSSHLISQLR